MARLKKIQPKSVPTMLDQQFALRLYSVVVQQVVTDSLLDPDYEFLSAVAMRRLGENPSDVVFHNAQQWIDSGLLHKTIKRGLLHVIGESTFWLEVASEGWAIVEEIDPSAFFGHFSTMLRIADLSAIQIPEELRNSFDKLAYLLDECWPIDQVELKTIYRQLSSWARRDFRSVAGDYVDDFANRALHDRQLCQEISLLCVNRLSLLFQSNDDVTSYKYTPNKGRRLFERKAWPSWVRTLLLARERGLCASCAISFLELARDAHVDHIVPLAEGGSNDVSNLQMLCSKCNLAKRDHHITVKPSFQNYIQVGKKIVQRVFVSLPPDRGGWYHPENIPPRKID
jgi:HNH endonuclease